jgi:hypothetical protein
VIAASVVRCLRGLIGLPRTLRETLEVVQRLEPLLHTVHEEGHTMSTQLDELTAAVARAETVTDSAIELIKGLSTQVRDAANDPVKIKELADALDQQLSELAEAVQAGTAQEATPTGPNDPTEPVRIGDEPTTNPDTRPVEDSDDGTPVPESNPTYPGTIDPNGPDQEVLLTDEERASDGGTDEGDAAEEAAEDTGAEPASEDTTREDTAREGTIAI